MRRTLMLFSLALGGLRRTPLRVALTSIGVMIGGGALFCMVGFAVGLQQLAETPFKKFQLLNNIEVRPPHVRPGHEFGPPRPEDDEQENGGQTQVAQEDILPLDDAALAKMRAIDGVEIAYPELRSRSIVLIHGEEELSTIAMGFPREVSLLGFLDEMIVAGDFFSQETTPEIVISRSLAEELGFASPEAAIGQEITIEASGLAHAEQADFTFEKERYVVRVVGVHAGKGLGPRMFARAVILPVDQMQQIPGVGTRSALEELRAGRNDVTQGYAKAVVRVASPSDVARVAEEIRAMGFKTDTLLDRLEEMRTFFVFIDVLLAAVGTVALIVATLGIVNTLLMAVLERYREIGIYKAIGASSSDLVTLFLAEASLIGLIGGLGGLALGYVVSWILNIAINAYAQTQGVVMPLEMFIFPVWLVVSTIAFTVSMSILAGVYPAMRAARVDPIQAIRKD